MPLFQSGNFGLDQEAQLDFKIDGYMKQYTISKTMVTQRAGCALSLDYAKSQ